MRSPRLRTWTLLAAVLVAIALGVGGSGRAGAFRTGAGNSAGVSRQLASTIAPDAVLRTDVDRVEGAYARTAESALRLLLLFAAALSGLALLVLLTPPRPTRAPGGPPSLARVRRWVGLRAPPSPSFVSLTS